MVKIQSSKTTFQSLFSILILSLMFSTSATFAQKKSKNQKKVKTSASQTYGVPVMWEPVNIPAQDLYYGPGGKAMQPDLSRITFIKEEKGGHNKKYRIKDGVGRVWVAKLGREAQPETSAVRIVSALGYKTEINYLIPRLTIPRKGTFQNVRLEARPENIERLENWKWKSNPFLGTKELNGLKIMMMFLNNWDIVDIQNKILLVDRGANRGKQTQYIISDLGSTFGKLGNNNLPIIYRLGRKTNNPEKYLNSSFIKGVEDGHLKLAYKGKNRGIFKNIPVLDARWLANLLLRLSDRQIEDAFRAANYTPNQIEMLKAGVKNRIKQLDETTRMSNMMLGQQ